jgi:uncharacterized membrane protein
MAYRERVQADLDRWIAAGLVPAENRAAILATVPATRRRVDAATALAWVGGVLFSVAIVAFVAANWDAIPRLGRFALILAAFLGFAGAGALAWRNERESTANIALTVAAVIFAAAIGLTGQIFDITGDPRAAAYGAGAAALALGLAGRASGAAIAALAFIAMGDFTDRRFLDIDLDEGAPWLLLVAPLGVYLAARWSSSALAQAAGLALIACGVWFAVRIEADGPALLALAALLAVAAVLARRFRRREGAFGSVFYGWFAAAALCFLAIAGYLNWFGAPPRFELGVAHRMLWLLASVCVIALGRFDRHALVTASGVLSLIVAIFALLGDLRLDLLTSALVFLFCAIAAAIAGWLMRERKARQ